jgi:RNA polymerase sigma-70 factor (ECF subfamily)
VRKLDRPGSRGFDAEERPASEESLSRVFDRAWAEAIVREASAVQEALANAQGGEALRRFELLRLQFEEELSIAEIAARWNERADALHKQAARARREFKEALRDVVAFHHPDSPELVERACRELLGLLA